MSRGRSRRLTPGAIVALLSLAALLSSAWPAQALQPSAPWTSGPVANGVPTGEGRHMRVPLDVTLPGMDRPIADVPAMATLDLGHALASGGWPVDADSGTLQGFSLDLGSLVLAEVDGSGQPIATSLPIQAFTGGLNGTAGYDPALNPVVTIRWILDGTTAPGATRHFVLYFDSTLDGLKSPSPPDNASLERLAASAGPGPGTRLYVPLYALPGSQGDGEARSVLVTDLWGPTQVQVFEYDARTGQPETSPSASTSLAETGDTWTYRLGAEGQRASTGRLLVVADRPVQAEAISAAQTSLFLPSLTGGLVGTTFIDAPPANSKWLFVCPQYQGTSPCVANVAGPASTQSVQISANYHTTVTPSGSGPFRIEATQGSLAIQRIGPAPGPGAGMTAWPPLDGPASATLFMGSARPSDALVLSDWPPADTQAKVRVQALTSGNPSLAAGPNRYLQPPAGLLDEGTELGATTWARPWETGNALPSGPAILQSTGVPLQVVSGQADSAGAMSILAPLQSADAGLTYQAAIPVDSAGTPLGKLVVFAPFQGTTVTAVEELHGAGQTVTLGPLLADETQDLEGGGSWTLHADRPIVVAWLKRGTAPFSGVAPGLTDLAQVHVGNAQAAGAAIGLSSDQRIVLARRPSEVEFEVTVSNEGRLVDGTPMADQADLTAVSPPGWSDVQVAPATVDLAPGAQAVVHVRALVPASDGSSLPSATIHLQASSRSNPKMHSGMDLRVNFVVQRGVLVTAESTEVEYDKEVQRGEQASFLLQVANVGTVSDAYDIDLSQAAASWSVTLSPLFNATREGQTNPLAPEEVASYRLDLQAPATGSPARLPLFFLATSQQDRSVSDGVRIVASIGVNRSIQVQVDPPIAPEPPGGQALFRINITNTADANDELEITAANALPTGWAPLDLERPGVGPVAGDQRFVSLEPGESVVLLAKRSVPDANATSAAGPLAFPFQLAVDDLTLHSTASRDPDRLVELRTLVQPVRGLQASLGTPQVSMLPGQSAVVNLTLDSAGDIAQPASVGVVLPADGRAWAATSIPAGMAGPWNVTVPANGTVQVPIRFSVPAGVPPTTQGPLSIPVTVAASGLAPITATLHVAVAPLLEASLLAPPVGLHPGVARQVEVPVRNLGNVPLSLGLSWRGLPTDWTVEPGPSIALGPGEAANLTARLLPPLGTPSGQTNATIVVNGTAGSLQGTWTASVEVEVGRPDLQLRLVEMPPLGPNRVYQLHINNSGDGPAYDVQAELLDAHGAVLDHAALAQVLPGHEQVVSFLGPADAVPVHVQVSASHLATPMVQAASGAPLPLGHAKPAPMPASSLLGAALLLAAVGRRRRA